MNQIKGLCGVEKINNSVGMKQDDARKHADKSWDYYVMDEKIEIIGDKDENNWSDFTPYIYIYICICETKIKCVVRKLQTKWT